MTDHDQRDLVGADWLAQHLDDGNLRVVDATWYLPGIDRDAGGE